MHVSNSGDRDLQMAKGALSLTLSVIFVKIIGLIYKVPLSYILGDEGMGYFNSAYTVFVFFYMLCSGGVPRAVSIIVTEMRVKEREGDIPFTLYAALAFFTGVGLAFTAVFIIFSEGIATLIGNRLSSFSLAVIAPSLTFVAASGVLRGYLVGYGKMGSVALSEMIDATVKFTVGMAFALFAIRRSMSAPMVSAYTVVGVTLGSFFGVLILFVSVKISKRKNKTRQKHNTDLKFKGVALAVLRISLPITLSSAIMGTANIIDLGMIMRRLASLGFSETEAVALYGNFTTVAVPMLNFVAALVSPVSTAALPSLARSVASGEGGEFSRLVARIMSVTVFITVPLAFGFYFFPSELLGLIFSDSSASIASPLLSALSPSVVALPLLTVVHTALEASRHQRLPILSMAVFAITKVALSYTLIGRCGIIGAPIATSISYAAALIFSAVLLNLSTGTSFRVFGALARPCLSASAAISIARMLYERHSPEGGSISVFLLSVLLSVILYLLFMIILSLKPRKKHTAFVEINKKEKA